MERSREPVSRVAAASPRPLPRGRDRVVWKYPLAADRTNLDMPLGADILTVQVQNQTPTLWALVEPDNVRETRAFQIVPTGGFVPLTMKRYVGTWQSGPFVWHLFEVLP